MSKHEALRNERIENALEEALNAAAPDPESWTAGHEAFYGGNHGTLDEQLEHALNAAAPDPESWTAGWDKFHELFHESASGFLVAKLRSIPSYFAKRK
jgi:hypothetical protein